MINFANFLDLPLVWLLILVISIYVYAILDGFDLGVGILLPFAPTEECKNNMMASISPFWDANETWLVLSGGVLFIAFPFAYAVVIPALYLPVIVMLIALVFRGVAFEFRHKASEKSRSYWDLSFHLGSLIATFMQGIIVGSIMQGFKMEGGKFVGGEFDWLTAFSISTGITLIFGYVLIGSTWLIMKTEAKTQEWARRCAIYSLVYVPVLMGIVSLWLVFIDQEIYQIWFESKNIFYLLPIPILTVYITMVLFKKIRSVASEYAPFFLTVFLFTLGCIGFGISLWPWAVPRGMTIWEAAASDESLSLVLIGVVVVLPVILGYTAYGHYVFRGKIKDHKEYEY